MASTREMRLRIGSIKNIAQVTGALETVSASYVRRATQAVSASQPYSEKAWKVLVHIARQPGYANLHPLLSIRDEIKNILVVMVSGDRGLAGAFNVNILRETLMHFNPSEANVGYVPVGRKGRDMLIRRRKKVLAEFSHMPTPPHYLDVAPIAQLVVDSYIRGENDEVYLAYTRYENMMRHTPTIRRLLPLKVEYASEDVDGYNVSHHRTHSVFSYEPDQAEILNEIVPRFTGLQIYQAILSSQASEHAARMLAMRNATDNANDLVSALQLDYNKARQQGITNDILDITSGAEALAAARS